MGTCAQVVDPESGTLVRTKPRVERVRSLVTGGAGFVGSHLCDYLVKRGDHVRSSSQQRRMSVSGPLMPLDARPARFARISTTAEASGSSSFECPDNTHGRSELIAWQAAASNAEPGLAPMTVRLLPGRYRTARNLTEMHKYTLQVICMDNFFTGTKENVAHLLHKDNFELIRHDVVNPILLEVDEIYHLACPASPVHYKCAPHRASRSYRCCVPSASDPCYGHCGVSSGCIICVHCTAGTTPSRPPKPAFSAP